MKKQTIEDMSIEYAMQVQYTTPPDLSVVQVNQINDLILKAYVAGFEESAALTRPKVEILEEVERAARFMYNKQAATIFIDNEEHVAHFFAPLKLALVALDESTKAEPSHG